MRLSLIGMSGVGKSHWARRIESQGYRRIICDDWIAEQLGPLINPDEKSTLELASWMGRPYQSGYAEAQSKYLAFETEVITNICAELEEKTKTDARVIVDTTGSLIYLKPQLIRKLQDLTHTVYLKLADSNPQTHYQTFLKDPKPVIWGDHYIPMPGEDREASLARCYCELLTFRDKEYRRISDCTLDYSFHHNPQTSPKQMLEAIRKEIKNSS